MKNKATLTHQEIGRLLRCHRQESEEPQRVFASLIGHDSQTIARIESGKRKLTVQELLFIESFYPGLIQRLTDLLEKS